MAIASKGSMGIGAHSTSASSFTHTTATTALNSGEIGILVVVTDNISTTDGNTNNHTSVTGGTGTWTKLREYTNSNGAAAAGITTSHWRFKASGSNAVGTVFTVNISGNVVDKCSSMWAYTVAANTTLAQTASASPIDTQVDGTTNFGSSAYSSLPSLSRLYFRGIGKEANSTINLTVSTNFTAITPQRSRNNSSAVIVRGEFRINTSTGETSNPTLAVSGDTASSFLALEEVADITPTRGQVSFTELEIPNVPTRGQISFTEAEVPDEVSLTSTRGQLSFVELETPDPLTPTRGRINFSEFEAPTVPTRGRISFVELELPTAPTRGRLSFTEFEIPTVPTRGRISFTELQVASVPTRGRISFTELLIPSLNTNEYHKCAVSGVSGRRQNGDVLC